MPFAHMRTVRVGFFLIFFGGGCSYSLSNFGFSNADCCYHSQKIFLWNVRRYKWYKGPKFPPGFGQRQRMCGIGINGSTAMFFGMTKQSWEQEHGVLSNVGYLQKLTLNIWNGKGIQVDDPYFHDFHDFNAFGTNIYRTEVDFDCTTMLTKNADL